MNKKNINISYRLAIFFVMVILIFSGCYSFQGASIPPDVTTYSVGFIENKAAVVNPKLSQSLTEKLKDKLNNTRLNFIRENGDFAFNGSITNYTIAPIAVQGDAVTTQNRLTISVTINFECAKHPKTNFTHEFSSFRDFDASKNFLSLENNLVAEITDQMVQEIFNKAAVNW